MTAVAVKAWDLFGNPASVQSIRDGITGKRCTAKTAKAIAAAWGYPARWPELVIVTKKKDI